MSNSLRPITAAVCHLLVWCGVAAAQLGNSPSASDGTAPVKPPAAAAAEQAPAARVEEIRPSVYYLPDKQGNLQPVLDFKYQDFVDLYNLKNQLGRHDEPPRYSLQRLSATGTAGEEYAELSIQIQVLVRDDDWVRIPVRLDEGWLRGTVRYKGSGEQFVHCEDDGYVCWMRGKSDSQHEIELTMLVPLVAAGDETRLELFFPRAAASELKLTVPMPNAVGKVSEGATLLPSAAKGDATELNVVGLAGDLQLAWSKSNPSIAQSPVVLEAAGTLFTRLDGRWISSEALLSVRSYGAPFDRFQVRLPPEAELAPGNPVNGYILSPVEAGGGVGQVANLSHEKSQQRLVEVRLPKKTAGPVEVRLACRRNYDPTKNPAWCELAGFEVVGAARQWGTTAVAAGGDWQLLWGNSGDVRQTDQLPETSRKEDLIAGFEYSTQPYSLSVRLVPRKTRVAVDPTYVLLVDSQQVRLEGTLTYTIRGAKIATLVVAIPGWELDEVGPDDLAAVDGVTVAAGNVAIPLAQPSSGTLELQLRAHRAVEAGAKSLSVPLPQPQAVLVGPATVAVLAADNVELTPINRAIEGLVRQSVAPPVKLPQRQQDPLHYRGTGDAAVFAADFRVHGQRIAVEVDSQVTLGRRTAEVEQRQSYSVAYEPVERLSIAVPRAVAEAKRFQVLCDDKLVVPIAVGDGPIGDDPMAPLPMQVVLPGPRIGACELTLQYSVATTEPGPQQSSTLAVPLPMPKDGKLVSNVLSVKPARNTRATVRKGAWTAVEREPAASGDRGDLRLSAARPAHRIDLELRFHNDDAAGATIVERAWVQTWLSSTARQDRAAYQLATNRKELEVLLPAGAAADRAVVLVDGNRVQCRPTAERRLSIPLPGERANRRLAIELRYHFPGPRPARGTIQMQFPQIDADVWMRRMYWQLVLPANEHLMANPAGFTGEFTWGWRGCVWGRQPTLDQGELESWVGAAPLTPLPERLNLYLFSTLGNVERAETYTAGRTWIVLWASGAALVAGLLLIYVPVSRHPATLLAAALTLLVVGLILPEPTLLLAQAASLGLALTLLAGFLERGTTRRRRRIAARKEPSSAQVELGSVHAPHRPPSADGVTSTEIMPAVQPTGNAEQ